MEITLSSTHPKDFKTDALAALITEENAKSNKNWLAKPPKGVTEAIKKGDFTGKQDEVFVVYSDDYKAKRIILVGLGKEKELTLEKIRRAAYLALEKVKDLKLDRFSIIPNNSGYDEIRAIVDGAVLGDYEFDKYITDKERKRKKIKNLTLLLPSANNARVKNAVDEQKIICYNQNFVRDLVNKNSLDKIPEKLANEIQKVARANKISCKILNEKDIEKLGMNLILGVNRGSKYPPRVVILEYYGDLKSKERIALVGKGITFDSGGLNLKPTGYLETMKQDMAGAATVVGTLITAAKLKLKKNLIGAIALTENMPGAGAQKPGDIIKSYSGITVEVANTDAEGRLILGDTIAYVVKKYQPKILIDLATLTGAVISALGDAVAGIFGNDDELIKKLTEAGGKTYERVWQLPIYDEHREDVKSEIADIKNIGFQTRIGYAGPIAGAAFIENFVSNNVKWAHIDIAGTAFMERKRYYLKKGATGFGIRLLIEFLKSR